MLAQDAPKPHNRKRQRIGGSRVLLTLRPQWHKKLGLAQPTSRTKGTFLNKGTAVRITGGKYKGLETHRPTPTQSHAPSGSRKPKLSESREFAPLCGLWRLSRRDPRPAWGESEDFLAGSVPRLLQGGSAGPTDTCTSSFQPCVYTVYAW